MSALIIILNIIIGFTAVFLILLVIAQSNKGSDLGLFGGSAEMVFGSGQMNAIHKMTMIFALIMMLSVFLVGFLKSYSTKNLRASDLNNQAIVLDSNQTKIENNSSVETKDSKDKK